MQLFELTEGPLAGNRFTDDDWYWEFNHGRMSEAPNGYSMPDPDLEEWQRIAWEWKTKPAPPGELAQVRVGMSGTLYAKFDNGLFIEIGLDDYPESIEDYDGLLTEAYHQGSRIITFNPQGFAGEPPTHVLWAAAPDELRTFWFSAPVFGSMKQWEVGAEYVARHCHQKTTLRDLMLHSKDKMHLDFYRPGVFAGHRPAFLWRAGSLWTAELYDESEMLQGDHVPGDRIGFYSTAQQALAALSNPKQVSITI